MNWRNTSETSLKQNMGWSNGLWNSLSFIIIIKLTYKTTRAQEERSTKIY